ncbi:DNA adenine methylase [Xenorhabdus anantnagensis]|uniref:site-specific DNA-methyltransferase (adenine-specific) n=1 Tax=Xenorhabdus anantnagensis TaxID=3025875 RepID=A0ABT5LRN1_9GAMM|nr:DNA adenine methylase [Xenorhabdus anantnagensis]MDC9597073.1 DNA adenine methylase [Xenorhabdus anantnagensis]
MGSKSRIAKHIASFILAHLTTETVYVEPFAGGMNMVSHINTKHAGPVIAADSHEYLIEMWRALLSGWQPPRQISREQYYAIKNNKDEIPHLTGWVGFNCSYAGKWFDGYAGATLTKSGIRDYQSEAINNIQRQIGDLDGVQLLCTDYKELNIPDGAVVYCDPPYANTRQYRDAFNTAEFWDWVRELSNRCTVLVSEYTAPDDFDCIWSREVVSGISGTKTTSIESLFMMK